MLKSDLIVVIVICIAFILQCISPNFSLALGISFVIFAVLFFYPCLTFEKGIAHKKSPNNSKSQSKKKSEWIAINDENLVDKFFNFGSNYFVVRANNLSKTPFVLFLILSLILYNYLISSDITPASIVVNTAEGTNSDLEFFIQAFILKTLLYLLLALPLLLYSRIKLVNLRGFNYSLFKFNTKKFSAIATLHEDASAYRDAIITKPQLKMSSASPHRIRDIRLLVQPAVPVPKLLCWHVQVSMVKVKKEDNKYSHYPYAYAVAVFKGKPKDEANFRQAVRDASFRKGRAFTSRFSYEEGNTVIVTNLAGDAYHTNDYLLRSLAEILAEFSQIFIQYESDRVEFSPKNIPTTLPNLNNLTYTYSYS